MSQQTNVTVLESRGVIEARKLKSQIEGAKKLLIETVMEIGRRYSDLEDHDKADFRRELGLSASTLVGYAAISERYLHRVKALPSGSAAAPLAQTVRFAEKLSRISDETFAAMVASGAVTLGSKSNDVARAAQAASPLQKSLKLAAGHIRDAALVINRIRTLMQKDGVTAIRGPEVRQLREEFQLLCAELMAADPETVERAKQVLKGAA